MVERFYIKGGIPLKGEVSIGGAKNSVLKLMAAALLAKGESKIYNVPDLTDVNIMLSVIEQLGAKTHYDKVEKSVTIDATDLTSVTATYELVSKMRASFIVLGALVSRCKEAKVALPGGCAIGERRVDFHIRGLEALGAKIKIENGYVHAKAPKLVGAEVCLDLPSVGATENIMLASVLAEGSSRIQNAAQEPEIVDLANFLNTMGADVKGAGTDVIRVRGVKKLVGCNYSVIPDQIEAGTFMIAAAATKGDITIKNVIPKHLESISAKLMEMGAIVEEGDDSVRVTVDKPLKGVSVKTAPYPGFPTDVQQPMSTLLSITAGRSLIAESIWENRHKHTDELKKMGAEIKVEGRTAIIDGVDSLNGAKVVATDLRAGAAMVIAGLVAKGETEISEIEHIDRGYPHIEDKFRALGADIRRIEK